ncbi:MAG: hypothetical protein IJ873_07580 [Lachnospiraceae bacterium]|nr:hypothetical protein [Lachnospiraceae bacterium]
MDSKNRISDVSLDNVSGGMVFNNTSGIDGADPDFPWEVLDNNNCRILGKFPSRDIACEFAKGLGSNSYNSMEVDWDTVQRLRNNPNT